MTTCLGLLSGRQSFFVDKMSQMVIRESSMSDASLSDEELSDWQADKMDYARRMVYSDRRADRRFINMYLVRLAQQQGIKFGF